ncbi:MAG TPA: TolC family protein [Caulobacteraceae bacterium]|nr:TolC family protein [Caulobacteraceae bacterium]
MKQFLLVLLAVTPLAACAAGGPVRSPDTRVPARFEAPAGAAMPAASLDKWWALYNDPELQRLVERALVNAPDAKTAMARLREARAQRNANRRLAYPTGDLTGSATDTYSRVIAGDLLNFPGFSNSGTSQSYGLNFNVSWEVDLFGRVREGNRLIEADYAATLFNIEGSRAALAAGVADALFAARGLAIQLADARETVRIRQDLNDVTQKRAQRGLSATSDAQRTAADLAQAQAQMTGLEADFQAARRQLLVLIGDGVQPIASLPVEASAGTAPTPPETVPGELLQRRPDVREAEARLRAALSKHRVDQLALFPTFTLRPGVGLQRTDQPSFSSTTENWSIGAGLTVPVLSRGRLKQLAKVSGAQAEEAVIAYEKAVQTAYGEAENDLVELAADRNRAAILAAGEAQARAAYDAARKGYGAGLTDLTTTLQAQQSWLAVRSALTSAQVQALRRSVQTFKALGGGWTPSKGGAA